MPDWGLAPSSLPVQLVTAPIAGVFLALLQVPGWTQQVGDSKLQTLGEAVQGNRDLEACRSAVYPKSCPAQILVLIFLRSAWP